MRKPKEPIFPLLAPSDLVDAWMTEAGVFYAYNVPRPPQGRVVFERTASLLKRF